MPDDFAELDAPLPPIKVRCTDVNCEQDLHCFLQKRRQKGLPPYGVCRECSADRIDWPRIHKRELADIEFTFSALMNEYIRQHMWTIEIDKEARRKAYWHGKEELYGGIRRRLASSIGKARGVYDGRQTKMEGNVIFYAQHATATCCRKCLNYWHNVPMDRPLTEHELSYCEALVSGYLDRRLPDLQVERNPDLRKKAVRKSKSGRK